MATHTDLPSSVLGLVAGPLTSFVEVPFVEGSEFRDLELQRMKLEDGSVAHLLRGRLPDGTLEIWAEPELGADAGWVEVDPVLSIAAVSRYQVVQFDELVYDLAGESITVRAVVSSSDGRHIVFSASAMRPPRTDDIFTPAVPGSELPMLRLMRLRDFWLMSRSLTAIDCSVDGRRLEPEPMGGPVGLGRDLWSARVAGDILVAGLAPTSRITNQVVSRVERNGMFFEVELGDAPAALALPLEVTSDLGEVTSAEVRILPIDSDRLKIVVSKVRQQWFPGRGDVRLLALYAARRIRRRGDNLQFVATLDRRCDGWKTTYSCWKRDD